MDDLFTSTMGDPPMTRMEISGETTHWLLDSSTVGLITGTTMMTELYYIISFKKEKQPLTEAMKQNETDHPINQGIYNS